MMHFVRNLQFIMVLHIGVSTSLQDPSPSPLEPCATDAARRYPEYFKTEAEYEELMNRYPVNSPNHHLLFTDETTSTTSSQQCTHRDSTGKCIGHDIRNAISKAILRFTSEESHQHAEGQRYHGCCISEPMYFSPDKAKDKDGKEVKLVQVKGQRQTFRTETCRQLLDCSIRCNCKQDTREVKAVVYSPDTGEDLPRCELMDIYIPGCCKCLNTGHT